ncbi:MAG: hypothetical protein N3D10_03375 [Candidatus Micrarchaeota archaeon]|nr:hypothetical protein [Candidatus Micrarchaeota archaeon]
MKKYFLLLVLLVGIVLADVSISNITTEPKVVRPGTIGLITMTIKNVDASAINSVTAEPSPQFPIKAGQKYYLGDFKPSSTSSFSFPFSVEENSEGGIFYINVRFTWLNGSGTFVKSVQIPIVVKNEPIFLIEPQTDKITTEGEFILPLKIVNKGGVAKNIRVELDSPDFYEIGKNKEIIQRLNKNEEKTLELKISMLENRASGAYNLPIKITYIDSIEQENTIIEQIKLVVIKKAPELKIELAPQQLLEPGSKKALKFLVKNNGDKTAYAVRVGIENQSVFTVLEGNYQELGDIGPNSQKEVSLSVGINDLKPGYYIQPFYIKLKDEKGNEKIPQLYNLGLDVQSIPKLNVFIAAKPSPMETDQEHVLTVVVSNVGITPVKSLVVELQSEDLILQEVQSEQYIGSLAEDDFSSVQFKIKTPPAEGKKRLKIRLKFLDNYNKEQVIEKNMEIRVYKKKENGPNPLFAAAAIAIVGGILVWYFKLRKRKDKHADK